MQAPETRAAQHLLVQGFILYPCAAAVCSRLVAPSVLDDPGHAWAVLFDSDSLRWTAMLPESDGLLVKFAEAAMLAQLGSPHVLCHTQGQTVVLPLVVPDVRDVRLRIEAAVALGRAPAAERLEAFPDELIEREAQRRAKQKSRQGASGANTEH